MLKKYVIWTINCYLVGNAATETTTRMFILFLLCNCHKTDGVFVFIGFSGIVFEKTFFYQDLCDFLVVVESFEGIISYIYIHFFNCNLSKSKGICFWHYCYTEINSEIVYSYIHLINIIYAIRYIIYVHVRRETCWIRYLFIINCAEIIGSFLFKNTLFFVIV